MAQAAPCFSNNAAILLKTQCFLQLDFFSYVDLIVAEMPIENLIYLNLQILVQVTECPKNKKID